MQSRTPSTLVAAGVLSLALAAGPLVGGAFAQATDPSRAPTDPGRAADTRDDDFDWGWVGLLGLLGLAGLKRREEPRTYRETQASHARP